MKTFVFSLFFAVFVGANPPRTFYALVHGKFEPLGVSKMREVQFLSPSSSKKLPIPTFNLTKGIATTGYGDQTKVFGFVDTFLAIGPREKVTPFHIVLNKFSKVLNLVITQCYFSQSSIRDKMDHNNGTVKARKCSTAQIYFLDPPHILLYGLDPLQTTRS